MGSSKKWKWFYIRLYKLLLRRYSHFIFIIFGYKRLDETLYCNEWFSWYYFPFSLQFLRESVKNFEVTCKCSEIDCPMTNLHKDCPVKTNAYCLSVCLFVNTAIETCLLYMCITLHCQEHIYEKWFIFSIRLVV